MWKTTLYDTTKLTVELREIVENGVDIWNFSYPSYYKGDEKKAFEQKVIDHYYLRQIGQETVGRFLHMFRTKVREIMPYYIELYKTVEIMNNIEDPFGNVDVVETFEQSTDASAKGTSESKGTETVDNNASEQVTNKHKFSNTPQGSIDNLNHYLTEGSIDENSKSSNINGGTEQNAEGKTASESSEKITHTLTRKGNQGVNTYAHDMIEFRTAIIDVDMMIINALGELFLGVY